VLQEKSILADKLALSCLQSGAKGTIVMLGAVYPTEAKALAQIKTFEKALKKAGLLRGKLLLRKLP
jgi:dihydrodipicolinate synthase/N-acetylneuraminate lyase